MNNDTIPSADVKGSQSYAVWAKDVLIGYSGTIDSPYWRTVADEASKLKTLCLAVSEVLGIPEVPDVILYDTGAAALIRAEKVVGYIKAFHDHIKQGDKDTTGSFLLDAALRQLWNAELNLGSAVDNATNAGFADGQSQDSTAVRFFKSYLVRAAATCTYCLGVASALLEAVSKIDSK